MEFRKEVTMYGDREVFLLKDNPNNPQFPGKTVFLDAATGDIVSIPDGLPQDASVSVYSTGQFNLASQNLVVSSYAAAPGAIKACDDGVLIIRNFGNGGYKNNFNKSGGFVSPKTWDKGIEVTNELIETISQETGTNFTRQHEFGVSMGDAVALREYASNNKNGILCIAGASCAPNTDYHPGITIKNPGVQANPIRAFLTPEEYEAIAGRTVFLFESKAGEKYTYSNTLVDNGVKVFLFETSQGTGSAHGDAFTKAFNVDIFDAMDGNREKLEIAFEKYQPKKRITDEEGNDKWVNASFNEVYKEVFMSNIGDANVKERFDALDEDKLISFIDTKPSRELLNELASKNERVFSNYINIMSQEDNKNIDSKLLFSYLDIVSSGEDIVGSINKTAINNGVIKHVFETNKSGFPDTLNSASNVLFGASSTLLGVTSSDMQNLGKVLNQFASLDNDFARAVADIDSSFTGMSGNENIAINGANNAELDKSSMYLFPDNLKKGTAGKITMTDIDSVLKGNMLIGQVANSLNREYDDAKVLQGYIEAMIDLPQTIITGDVWNAEKARLEELSNCCTLRMNAVNTLEEAYIRALSLVRDYVGDDPYLDDGEIPQKKAALRAAKAVPPWRGTGMYTEYGDEIVEPNEPQYSEAQALIPVLEAAITKLEGLADILNQANQIVASAVDEVNANYVNAVKSLQVVDLN